MCFLFSCVPRHSLWWRFQEIIQNKKWNGKTLVVWHLISLLWVIFGSLAANWGRSTPLGWSLKHPKFFFFKISSVLPLKNVLLMEKIIQQKFQGWKLIFRGSSITLKIWKNSDFCSWNALMTVVLLVYHARW